MFHASSRSEGRAGAAGNGDPFAPGRNRAEGGVADLSGAGGGDGAARSVGVSDWGSGGAGGWRIRTRKGVSESTSRSEGSSASNPTNPSWSASEIVKNLLRTLRPIAAKDWQRGVTLEHLKHFTRRIIGKRIPADKWFPQWG